MLVFQFFQITHSKRALFAQKYDASYLKDHFEHSQWALPLSKRIIGDDELFAYIGYSLVNGGSITGFDSEVPPLGKYLIGFSIKIFNNPFYHSILFGLGSLILFYIIGVKVLGDKYSSLFAVSILFLDPLFFSQFWQSMLDIYQLFFLLAHILFLTYLIDVETNADKKRIFCAIMSGLSLGFFAQVKFPILLPLIMIAESIFFISKKTKKEYFLYLIGIALAISIANIKFFIDGNSIIDFFRFQKYIVFFYLKSQLTVHVGAVWQVLFLGKFPNITAGPLISIYEWWILWPVITLFGILMAIFSLFSKSTPILNKGIAAFLLATLIIFTFIPIYPRYLLIVLPFLYLFGVIFLKKFSEKVRIFLYLALLVFGIINSFLFLTSTPDATLTSFYYNLSNLYFHDAYQENIADRKALNLTRDQFRYIANKAFEDAQIEQLEIKELERNIPMFASNGDVKIRVIYKTLDLGAFYEEKNLKLVKKDNEWKIVWDWNIILNGFNPGNKLESQIIWGKRGSIIDGKGNYLVRDIDGYLLSVNPEKIDLKRERDMLKTLSLYGYIDGVYFQNAYLENVLPNSSVPIMTLSSEISQKEKNLLLSYRGTSLTPYPSRVFVNVDGSDIGNTFYEECCTRIYSSYNYHGIKGTEKKYDNILWGYSGGRIVMKDSNGTIIRIVLEKDKKDGKDVILQ